MGVRYQEALFLINAAKRGIKFDRTLTLGRQTIYMSAPELCSAFRRAGAAVSEKESARLVRNGERGDSFAEEFLLSLGAGSVEALDKSSYEQAVMLHDLNEPIPTGIEGQFDTVIDLGTLEHVFNIPIALRNCLALLKNGGHYLAALPCNNAPGHGFYQFSPEFLFSVLSEQNGMEIKWITLCEITPKSRFHLVPNPSQLKRRVEFVNRDETYIFVHATKRNQTPGRLEALQSDYVDAWLQTPGLVNPIGNTASSCRNTLRSSIPEMIANTLRRFLKRPLHPADIGLRNFQEYRIDER